MLGGRGGRSVRGGGYWGAAVNDHWLDIFAETDALLGLTEVDLGEVELLH
jgi:hypothetical protein